MLSYKDKKSLQRINSMLKENYDFKISFSEKLSKQNIDKLEEHAKNIRSKILETKSFNSYHNEPQYNKALLILEAVDILKDRKTQSNDLDNLREDNKNNKDKDMSKNTNSNVEKLKQLEVMHENYVKKNGSDEKSKKLNEKILGIKRKMFENDTGKRLKMILSEEGNRAETIMTAKGLLDDVISHQAKISEMLYQTLDSFIRMINDEYDNDTAEQIREKLTTSLQSILDAIENSKNDFYETVNVLSGEEELSDDDSMDQPESDIGSLEDDEGVDSEEGDEEGSDDFDIDLDDEGSGEESEEGDEEDIDLDLGDSEEEFKRRE